MFWLNPSKLIGLSVGTADIVVLFRNVALEAKKFVNE